MSGRMLMGVVLAGVIGTVRSVCMAQDYAFPPPEYAGVPSGTHAVTNRAFTGIPSMAVSPGGRLWATWYAGVTPNEDQNNYVVLSTSGDNGKTWSERLVVDPDAEGPRRAFDPQLWIAPDGKLRWFWADRRGGEPRSDGLWMMVLDDPDSETSTWAKPVRVSRGVMMGKPLTLTSGEWVFPVCTWFTEQSSKMEVSQDNGKTWAIRGGATLPPKDRLFDEHQFVERKDGSIWLLSRTKYGIAESVSTDRGVTWPKLKPSKLAHPSARFFVRRLASGNLLLVKHGPLFVQTGRSHLTAYLSTDDGATWQGGLLLDERSGVSYPDGQQDKDGLIRIIYDFDRTGARLILMAAFHEADVLSGRTDAPGVVLRRQVSKGSGGRERTVPPVALNDDGQPPDSGTRGAVAGDGMARLAAKKGAVLFTDRRYTLAEWPVKWTGATVLRVPMDGSKTVRCTRAGTVVMLTPAPNRNHDSQTDALLAQGFKKTCVPEIRLFDPANAANFCTAYQKRCADKETLTFGKWAVPVMLP